MSKELRVISETANNVNGRALYEADEHLWMAQQIEALRTGRLDEIDRASLAEYLTEMTSRDRRELGSRLRKLLQHLLKIRFQPDRMSRSWSETVRDQQNEISDILETIPSLRSQAVGLLAKQYPVAVRDAAHETGLSRETFPAESPWTVDEALAFESPVVPSYPSGPRKRRNH
jgi:hypothetical protein